MDILGLDIGGANIKAADCSGRAVSRPFPIWKDPQRLCREVELLWNEFPQATSLALTMTAELADCFTTKSEGVRFILDQVRQVRPDRQVLIWGTSGRFLQEADANQQPMLVAAANWHALATWIGQSLLPEPVSEDHASLVIDIGTTTTDIIPLVDGRPATTGRTDVTRLQSGELCYSGVRRTPLCAVAHSVPFRDGYCPLAAELFATTLDLYLLLDEIAEDFADVDTANGKPATKAAAHDRIARSLCGDRDEVTFDEAVQIARFLADVQRQRLAGALERVLQQQSKKFTQVIISGSGSFLARRLIAENRKLAGSNSLSLDKILSPQIAEAACAYAVAQLASDRI